VKSLPQPTGTAESIGLPIARGTQVFLVKADF